MSVMIGIARGGKVVMAADSLWTTPSMDGFQMVHPKIERRGEVLFSVGPASGIEYALWDEVLAVMESHHDDWWEHWAAHCLGAATESVISRLRENDENDLCQVGWRGRVFKVCANGCISEYADGITTTGCGGDFARAAATMLLKRCRNIRTVAIKAAELACELSAGCAPPIIYEVM